MTKRANCKACSNLIHGVKTRKAVPHTCSKEEQTRVRELVKTKVIIESGYAGVIPNGNIVDRREYSEAIPIPANPLFNTPEPKEIKRKK